MDSIIKFASGLSTVENYARDVYIKSNLTIELDKVVNLIIEESQNQSEDEDLNKILIETPSVMLFCDIIETIFLHGLKEKFSTIVSNVFNSKSQPKNVFCLDFWPIIKILSHNEESKQLKGLSNINTDIGRCRAWLRLSLNECLLRSYFNSLICDFSTLNSFYKSSAYLRDSQHTEMVKNLLYNLDDYIFNLNPNNDSLNTWSANTFDLLGISIQNEDSYIVTTALDAIHLINENKSPPIQPIKTTKKKKDKETIENKNNDVNIIEKVEPTLFEMQDESSELSKNLEEEISKDSEKDIDLSRNENNELCLGNSLSVKSGWSTQPMILEESYNALLESYSTRAILSSTPDIKGSIPFVNNDNLITDNDFEIIPKNMICNDDAENQKFLEQISKLSHEFGLDEQDYKCYQCSRPIGMIYGKCTLCHIDGHLYCSECHNEEESVIPAQIIYNWNFKKFPISKSNKTRLAVIENEPIFDLKVLSPNLYTAIPEMAEISNLRTQLFFLHAYLFTCQEHIALKMRKLVWPREHLFEHIHLYSINDLQQIYNNALAVTLRQVITFARKHIFECNLCKLKGFYCEICKNSEILYPFDTDTTRRCDKCKTVFHVKCYDEKYDKNNCSKCLRIAKKRNNFS